MSKQPKIQPELLGAEIITLYTVEECIKYFGKETVDRFQGNLADDKSIQDYLPFYMEKLEVETYTVDEDQVLTKSPKLIECKKLVFNCGSITSYVGLEIRAEETLLLEISEKNDYQIKMLGTDGPTGINGDPGDEGSVGRKGDDKSGEKGEEGGIGGPGDEGDEGEDGGDGGKIPESTLKLGKIILSSTDRLSIIAQGGSGGKGGDGGKGGKGGTGGKGGDASSGSCNGYDGGRGGQGGDGGIGGKGGDGGHGSKGNHDMEIELYSEEDKSRIHIQKIYGKGGAGGKSEGGDKGSGGDGGSGSACGGKQGDSGVEGEKKGEKGPYGIDGQDGSTPVVKISVLN